MLNNMIETLLTIGTLAGYIMLTMYNVPLGAALSLLSNIGWIMYNVSPGVGLTNVFFAVVNILILAK